MLSEAKLLFIFFLESIYPFVCHFAAGSETPKSFSKLRTNEGRRRTMTRMSLDRRLIRKSSKLPKDYKRAERRRTFYLRLSRAIFSLRETSLSIRRINIKLVTRPAPRFAANRRLEALLINRRPFNVKHTAR